MRIALVSPYDLAVPGGVQSHVRHLAGNLREQGDDVLTISPGVRDAEGHRAVGATVRVPFNDSVAPITLSPRAPGRTIAALRDFKPDVVHVHEPAVPAVGVAAALRAPAPVVGTFHAWSDRDRAYRLARPLTRRVAGRLGARIAVSPAAAAYHAAAIGIPEGSFRVVPNAVDVDRFAGAAPFPQIRAADGPVLLFVGRLEPRKGLEHLVRAFPIVKTHRPDVRLLVVGDGPERERCQALLPASLRVDVDFLGRVANEDLPRFYASCDLFVAPALGGESFGIVLIEALAAGATVVASDIPGYRSVLHDGVNGRLVPPGDPRALADAIGALLDNPATRAAMSREGRSGVAEYDWSAVTARLRRVYADVVG